MVGTKNLSDPKTVAKTRIAYSRSEKCSNASLIEPEKVYIPPVHIKLGIKKTLVKAMDQNSAGFMYLKNKLGVKGRHGLMGYTDADM